MILCDLPYGTTRCSWDSIIPFECLWKQYKRIIKDGSAIVLTAAQPFTSKLVMSNLGMFKYEWIWDKHIPRGFQTARYCPMNKHESVLVFGVGRLKYRPIMVKRDKPVYARNYSKKGADSSNSIGEYNDVNKRFTYTHKSPDTIITGCWEPNKGKVHPTQKPVTLFEYLINTYTDAGDLVLDNCIGSGTTAIAAINTGRNFIGIETNAGYVEIANKRITERLKQL
jgi:site-specific DNA-methyltransferase (adenine-specific)